MFYSSAPRNHFMHLGLLLLLAAIFHYIGLHWVRRVERVGGLPHEGGQKGTSHALRSSPPNARTSWPMCRRAFCRRGEFFSTQQHTFARQHAKLHQRSTLTPALIASLQTLYRQHLTVRRRGLFLAAHARTPDVITLLAQGLGDLFVCLNSHFIIGHVSVECIFDPASSISHHLLPH